MTVSRTLWHYSQWLYTLYGAFDISHLQKFIIGSEIKILHHQNNEQQLGLGCEARYLVLLHNKKMYSSFRARFCYFRLNIAFMVIFFNIIVTIATKCIAARVFFNFIAVFAFIKLPCKHRCDCRSSFD